MQNVKIEQEIGEISATYTLRDENVSIEYATNGDTITLKAPSLSVDISIAELQAILRDIERIASVHENLRYEAALAGAQNLRNF